MAIFSKDIQSMDDLFTHMLQDIYYAEQQIEKALPEMIEKAADEKLRGDFEAHLGETRTQIQRLEEVFQLIGKEPKGTTCPAIDGIIKEAKEVAGEIGDTDVLNAALAAAAQAVEHYEITRYGTLISWAKEMGRNDCVELFEATLAEEKAADEKLTAVAEQRLNRAA